MAANVDSPKRRSLRLQKGSSDHVPPEARGPQGPQSRTSGPRTRLSGGKRNDPGSGGGSSEKRPQRSSRGQKAEDDGSRAGAKAGNVGPSGATAEVQLPGGATCPQKATAAPDGRSIRTRRSRELPQDNGKPSPSVVNKVKTDAADAGSSQVSGKKGQENMGKTNNMTSEVTLSSILSSEKAEPSIVKTRTDVEEAGPSAVDKVGSRDQEAGPSGVDKVCSSDQAGPSGVDKVGSRDQAGPSGVDKVGSSDQAGPSGVDKVASSHKARPVGVDSRENAGPSGHKNPISSVSSPSKRFACGSKSPVRNADQGTMDPAPPRDSRVRCTSKQLLQEVLGMCAGFSKEILESQKYLNPEQKELEHKNVIWNFETTFQDNISINGESWHEAPDAASEPDIKILEDQLDDAIVETAMKRKRHPRKILGHFVKGLKVEREILDHYKPVVEPKKLKLDSTSEARMAELTSTTASISQQIKETMKSLPAQLEKAEGFSQVLNLQPMLQGSRIRQDIFSSHVVLKDMAKTVPTVLETTPGESEPAANVAPVRVMKRRQSPSVQNNLYPLRSKRKISLEG
ncbi:kinetochore-associated protein NSL1 homolog [Engystomops pustulosus]|uniref:kinetochore-associated protein NSL1 homolog n=1 Tax=Engystomops pustulosus TaxID=76066 RepID=UPI003AFA9812